jgi:hypothetical protein
MSRKTIVALILVTVASAGCQSTPTPPAHSTTTTPGSSNYADIPGQFPTPATTTQAGVEEAPIGSCVKVTGTPRDAGLRVADCGGPDATHRIIQRVTVPDECVADIDRRFYQNSAAGEWTACLDIYWTTSDCLSITDTGTRRVSCDDKSVPTRTRATTLVLNATTLDGCKSGGYAHPVRRFTICAETQR